MHRAPWRPGTVAPSAFQERHLSTPSASSCAPPRGLASAVAWTFENTDRPGTSGDERWSNVDQSGDDSERSLCVIAQSITPAPPEVLQRIRSRIQASLYGSGGEDGFLRKLDRCIVPWDQKRKREQILSYNELRRAVRKAFRLNADIVSDVVLRSYFEMLDVDCRRVVEVRELLAFALSDPPAAPEDPVQSTVRAASGSPDRRPASPDRRPPSPVAFLPDRKLHPDARFLDPLGGPALVQAKGRAALTVCFPAGGAPNQLLVDVLANVHSILGLKQDTETVKGSLKDMGPFLQKMRYLDHAKLTDNRLQPLKEVLKRNPAVFVPEEVSKASSTCAVFSAWLRAVMERSGIDLKPLQRQGNGASTS